MQPSSVHERWQLCGDTVGHHDDSVLQLQGGLHGHSMRDRVLSMHQRRYFHRHVRMRQWKILGVRLLWSKYVY